MVQWLLLEIMSGILCRSDFGIARRKCEPLKRAERWVNEGDWRLERRYHLVILSSIAFLYPFCNLHLRSCSSEPSLSFLRIFLLGFSFLVISVTLDKLCRYGVFIIQISLP